MKLPPGDLHLRIKKNFILFLILFLPLPIWAQEITKDQYLDYLPLMYPKLQPQTTASQKFHLYGDRDNELYLDIDPVDGIDDHRWEILHSLALKFAPYLVLNTTNVPMDFKSFMNNRNSFPLYVDTWNIAGAYPEIIRSESINFVDLKSSSCDSNFYARERPDNVTAISENSARYDFFNQDAIEDCKLLSLIEEFYPANPKNNMIRNTLISSDPELFKVLYFDFPGEGPESWKEIYQQEFTKTLPDKYQSFVHTYVHPFITEVRSNASNSVIGYEFILQYWFFYPTNDGGNNHEGDWEHLNVSISPLQRVTEFLSERDIEFILSGDWRYAKDRELAPVIKRLQYYFHHFYMELDFSAPNVYQSREAWEGEIKAWPQERYNEKQIWKRIRELAYYDKEEQKINTHPVGFIGADNKGLDQILAFPGGKNRDSHGTYPFSGLYKDIGPAGATEQVSTYLDVKDFLSQINRESYPPMPELKRGSVVSLVDSQRVTVVPDWERVIDLVQSDFNTRRDWSWLILPIRWGYPATVSPFAGILKHVDTGNASPVGPAFSSGWNIAGESPEFHTYEPHELPSIFPLQFQDNFENNLGFLNLTYPVFLNLPPLDFLWKIAAYPFRAVLKKQRRVYYPKEGIPERFFGAGVSATFQKLPDEYKALSFNERQFDEFFGQILFHFLINGFDSTTVVTGMNEFQSQPVFPSYHIFFYIGSKFTSENMIRNFRTSYGFTAQFNNIPDYTYSADINFWEYAGSIRYNLTSAKLKPFIKAGYGLSWYRLENVRANGRLFETAKSDWIRKPSLSPLKNLLPNTWHVGGGLEFLFIKNAAPFPRGVDLSVRAEYVLFYNKLGLDLSQIPLEKLGLVFSKLGDVPDRETTVRHNLLLSFSLNF